MWLKKNIHPVCDSLGKVNCGIWSDLARLNGLWGSITKWKGLNEDQNAEW